MAKQVTLSYLRARSRELADQESDVEFVDDAELTAHINASYGQWYDMVSTADPERFGTTVTINANGSSSYALPSDHYKTIGIDYKSGDAWIPLQRVTVQERLVATSNTTASRADTYRFWGSTVILEPEPSTGEYRHLYIPVATDLVEATDTIDGVNGWEAWIYYDAAIKMLLKEESSPSWLIRERKRIEESIEVMAQERDMTTASRIHDSRTRYRYRSTSRYPWWRDYGR